MNISKIKKQQQGFTLLETLIAIFILTLAITGPIYIASFSLRNTIDSRDNISAQYLAEEAIEVIRNERDRRSLQEEVHWLSNFISSIFGPNANCFNEYNLSDHKCIMKRDVENKKYLFESCIGVDCPSLSFSSDGNVFYGDSTLPSKSKFTREIHIEKGLHDTSTTEIPDSEAKVVVNVKWKTRGQNKIYTLKENLYNIDYNFFTK
jgi:prepilin-type N-terminal cleavage/methylation domain-containing protein